MSRTRPSANALKDALRREKTRFDKAENLHFDERRSREQSALSSRSFPRSLESGTFFTPHLQAKRASARSEIANEYMVLIARDDRIITARAMYNPVRERATHLPSGLPMKIKGVVYRLEKNNYRFIGTNKDILVFAREFNQKQRDRHWAFALSSTLVVGVTALTAAIFAGQYIYA